MGDEISLSFTAATVLRTVAGGASYGFEIMQMTGFPSGTVYPALRRLERAGLIGSEWEAEERASAEQRPARKYYRVNPAGDAALAAAVRRYRLLEPQPKE